MDILFFHYLPLKARAELGAWELVPVHKLELVDANSKDDFVRVGQLVELYEPSRVALRRPGAVVGPARGKIGDTVDRSLMKPLRRAVLAAALDLNPVHVIPPEEPSSDTDEEDRRDSDASGVYTSDAATLWGHIQRWGICLRRVWVDGPRARGRDTVGLRQGRIAAPVELHVPSVAAYLDAGYASALYGLLTAGDERSRLLGRLIDWLDLAWRNTTSISDRIRIACIHSGLEVLLASPTTRRSYARRSPDCLTTRMLREHSGAGGAASGRSSGTQSSQSSAGGWPSLRSDRAVGVP